jgi:hypothetical protein
LAGARRFFRRAPLTYQPACKPGSVRPAAQTANVTAIPLVRRLPGASSNLPERLARTDLKLAPQRHSYSVLLPVGFAVPFPSLETRCALTAPFHPYRDQNTTQPRRSVLCGTVPEASLRLRGGNPRRTLSGTVRPWSPDFPPRPPFGIGAERPSGRLTGIAMGLRGFCVKAAGSRALNRPLYASGAGRVSSRARSVSIVDASARPSTRAWRKWRWNAVTTSNVASS